jgi:hypothetical protein
VGHAARLQQRSGAAAAAAGGAGSGRQARDHAGHVVQALRAKLAVTSSTFKDVLETRTQVQCTHVHTLTEGERESVGMGTS